MAWEEEIQVLDGAEGGSPGLFSSEVVFLMHSLGVWAGLRHITLLVSIIFVLPTISGRLRRGGCELVCLAYAFCCTARQMNHRWMKTSLEQETITRDLMSAHLQLGKSMLRHLCYDVQCNTYPTV